MSTTTSRRTGHSLLPDIAEFFGAVPTFATLHADRHLIRVEDEMGEDKYVVRAELPGLDPAKDVEVTVHDGLLTISATRTQKKETDGRSEFSYGSFSRTVSLPGGHVQDQMKADYHDGILTVTVPISEPEASAKKIDVTTS
ncbi:Hsp20/alpha crystallin family protein [Gordonia sp. Z-3]|jgi:HSP20 family molecular chaperone IbpA|uniref:Hsp20/alpha crystallin family protein n=1 Tax=Gordonia sp. Z-3 TaxID=3115408 RepID=UPI002E29FECD|nr:Hsp20/alpha crystallin family protein [Gordonia sp. Z-3]MED5800017.1 Hsp20/alpha crystallin family protein [Gordonia sp. Z-3]